MMFKKQYSIKKELYRLKISTNTDNKASLLERASSSLKSSIELNSGKSVSNWLSVPPLQEHNFCLHKSAFHDAVALGFGWDPARLPLHCVCGTKFSVELRRE